MLIPCNNPSVFRTCCSYHHKMLKSYQESEKEIFTKIREVPVTTVQFTPTMIKIKACASKVCKKRLPYITYNVKFRDDFKLWRVGILRAHRKLS